MLSEKMQAALNKQINEELYSAYIYLAMAAYFEEKNYPGMAQWMRIQHQEELVHANRFYDYLIERQCRVKLQAIAAPPETWESPLAAFENAFKHEQHISGCINDLVTLARSENDHATDSFLQWFVDEQVEEESSVDAVVQDLRRVESFAPGLFLLDRELGQRVLAAPGAGA